LFDLGPHLIDQALGLFGPPSSLWADVRIDRENGAADDAFDIRLEYTAVRRMTVWLRSTLTACIPGPRFLLHGVRGSFVKWGLDPQEDQLKAGMTYASPGIGVDPESAWGELRSLEGGVRRVATVRGDYRGFYENVRDAAEGKAELVVKPEAAWRTARLIELARESSGQGRRVQVDLNNQP
jgi:predicted dehydrogenase